MVIDWNGYNSTRDKTNIAENVMVEGSQNVYKALSGNLLVREGQQRRGDANSTLSPVSSEFVWNTSWGATYTLVVSNSTLYVVIDDVWYTLQTSLTKTRYVFDKWWNNIEKKDRLLFVNGTDNMYHWSGGYAVTASVSTTAISITGNNASLTQAITASGTAPFTAYLNSLVGTSFNGSIVFSTQPTNGQTLILTINGTPVSIQFVTVIGAVAGNVLIGATLANTLTNLLGLLASPGTTNATQVALSGGNQTLVNYSLYAIENTITKTGSTTWRQAGFSTTSGERIFIENGITYTYNGGEDTLTLFGIIPDPTPILAGATILQAVITEANTPADGFLGDFMKVINNQVYVGSYTSRLCYISASDDFSNYVVPTPRAPGDPELLTLDATLKGIGIRQGKAHIGYGASSWAIISFNDITVGSTLTQQTTVDTKPVALGQAPYAHEFIDNVGDNIIYLGQDQQVRSFGDFNNLFTSGYPSLSQEIATELSAEDFTGGSLRCIGEFMYVVSANSGLVYLRQERTTVDFNGNIVAERIWHSPFTWNVSRIDDLNGRVIGFSNANPQIYNLWDTEQWYDDCPSDEELPYSCVIALGYRTNGRRQGLQSFDKLFTEGYIQEGTPLNFTINYDYLGSKNIVNGVINSINQPTTFFGGQDPSSLGDSSLGDESLGSSEMGDGFAKFKNINSLSIIDCFEYQPILYSEEANARWGLLALGTNAESSDLQQANFIINKI